MLKTKEKAITMMFAVPLIFWALLTLPVSAQERSATTYFSNGMWTVEIQEAFGAADRSKIKLSSIEEPY